MRVGLFRALPGPTAPAAPRPRDLLTLAARAEQLGYDALWLDWRPASSVLALADALLLAAGLLGRTRRLEVGLLTPVPLVGAARAGSRALLDELFEGRFATATDLGAIGPRRYLALVEQADRVEPVRAAALQAGLDAAELLIGQSEAVVGRLLEQQTGLGDALLLLDLSLAEPGGEPELLERFGREVLPRLSPQPMIPPTFA